MKIQILGTGCPKCKKLYDNASVAIKEAGIACELEKIEDIEKITEMGVMMTPALAIDGEVKFVGKVVDVAGIKKYLTGR
ncbi:MAG: TM0996/MTH895 family glutaredoxin-like protein [Oligoflexia bacterium]|nr:TM0996/MTH895 family glutaredoxin-like protein [Oligoflexia bacterium]